MPQQYDSGEWVHLTEEMFQFESALGTVMPVRTLRTGHRLGWKYQRCMILASRSPWTEPSNQR